MDYVDLGTRIRQRRQQLGWTQEALAKEIGMSTSFVGHIERGSRAASLETLVQIANVMDVSMDELLSASLTGGRKGLRSQQRRAMRQVLDVIRKNLDDWGEEENPES